MQQKQEQYAQDGSLQIKKFKQESLTYETSDDLYIYH